MKHAFDLRLGALKTAYTDGSLTPRQLILALREQAVALNPEFNLFIHLLSAAELEPYLTALDGKSPVELPLFGCPLRSRTISTWLASRPLRPARPTPIRPSAAPPWSHN